MNEFNINCENLEKKYNDNPIKLLKEYRNYLIDSIETYQNKITNNTNKSIEEFTERLKQIENKIDSHSIKIEKILDESQINKNKIDKINDLINFSKKTTDQIMTIDIRLNNFQKEFSNATYKYDKIFLENLHLPGTIGDYCKYKNLREYIEVSKYKIFIIYFLIYFNIKNIIK
jgi:hypothetical protein